REGGRQSYGAHAQRLLRISGQEINAGHALASHARLPAASVAQPVPLLAAGDLLGTARRADHIRRILAICMETAARVGTVLEVGGPHEVTRPGSGEISGRNYKMG